MPSKKRVQPEVAPEAATEPVVPETAPEQPPQPEEAPAVESAVTVPFEAKGWKVECRGESCRILNADGSVVAQGLGEQEARELLLKHVRNIVQTR